MQFVSGCFSILVAIPLPWAQPLPFLQVFLQARTMLGHGSFQANAALAKSASRFFSNEFAKFCHAAHVFVMCVFGLARVPWLLRVLNDVVCVPPHTTYAPPTLSCCFPPTVPTHPHLLLFWTLCVGHLCFESSPTHAMLHPPSTHTPSFGIS